MNLQAIAPPGQPLAQQEMQRGLDAYIQQTRPHKLLLLPPDLTRFFSGAGALVSYLWKTYSGQMRIDILPALGSHLPMQPGELERMFPGVPQEAFLVHRWREDCLRLGEVPEAFVREVSGGLLSYPIAVEVNHLLIDGGYDAVLSLGQVVPHEVAGMANYSKNIFVGVGGSEMIHRTHFLGAVCGMEQAMGQDFAPVRRVFDWAQQQYLGSVPLMYAYTVVARRGGVDAPVGFFLGEGRDAFEAAVALSQRENIIQLDRAPKTVVCFLEEEEYRSTWVGNKAIYRSRMALADGGKLVVFAPGVRMLGEDPQMDTLLRKFGYVGRQQVLRDVERDPELAGNLSAAAHLIHGSSEGRFSIHYAAPRLGRKAIESQARFQYLDWEEGVAAYHPERFAPGWNTLPNGEEVYYIDQPALGLWKAPR